MHSYRLTTLTHGVLFLIAFAFVRMRMRHRMKMARRGRAHLTTHCAILIDELLIITLYLLLATKDGSEIIFVFVFRASTINVLVITWQHIHIVMCGRARV